MNEKIKKILIGMLEPDETGMCEFEKMLKYQTVGSRRNEIRHDMDVANYLKENGIEKTPIIPLITEMRSAVVLQTVIFLLLES